MDKNIKILKKLNIRVDKLSQEKPMLFQKILQAMVIARAEAQVSAESNQGGNFDTFNICNN